MHVTEAIGILYGVYTLLAATLFWWFIYGLTHEKKIPLKFKISLEVWIVFLSLCAVAFHVLTYVKLPWVKWEFSAEKIVPKKEITVDIKDYNFHFSEFPVSANVGEPVKFKVTSQDVTYGFGVFRPDGTMVFQMQVVPGYSNDILWFFQEPGRYTVRSTEYSGSENWKMVVRDAVVISPAVGH